MTYHERQRTKDVRKDAAEIVRKKKLALQCSRMIKKFWQNITRLVLWKHKQKWEKRKKLALGMRVCGDVRVCAFACVHVQQVVEKKERTRAISFTRTHDISCSRAAFGDVGGPDGTVLRRARSRLATLARWGGQRGWDG
jgi:hypothetical protein